MSNELGPVRPATPSWRERAAEVWRSRAGIRRRKLRLFLGTVGAVFLAAGAFVIAHPDAFSDTDQQRGQAVAATSPQAANSDGTTAAAPAIDATQPTTPAPQATPAAAAPSPPLYCRDDTGIFQPFVHTDLARLDAGFRKAYGWSRFDLPGGVEQDGTPFSLIAYAPDRAAVDNDAAVFVVQHYGGGLGLFGRLQREPGKKDERSQGTDMCGTLLTMLTTTGSSEDAGSTASPATTDDQGGTARAGAVPGWSSQ